MIEGSGSIPLLMDPDADPGGQKTCGSGGSGSGFRSATLQFTHSPPAHLSRSMQKRLSARQQPCPWARGSRPWISRTQTSQRSSRAPSRSQCGFGSRRSPPDTEPARLPPPPYWLAGGWRPAGGQPSPPSGWTSRGRRGSRTGPPKTGVAKFVGRPQTKNVVVRYFEHY